MIFCHSGTAGVEPRRGLALSTTSHILFNTCFMMFMGFSPPASSITSGYTWLYDISLLRFPLATMEALVLANCDELPTWNETTQSYENVGSKLGCQPMDDAPVTVGHTTPKEYTEDYFGMEHDKILRNFAIVIGYMLLFRVVALLSLRYINHQKRYATHFQPVSFSYMYFEVYNTNSVFIHVKAFFEEKCFGFAIVFPFTIVKLNQNERKHVCTLFE
ncbi:CDR ABC transporter [Phytophthora cactorum]|nr:CDR ABC transporter [Phytophthora cactorum]